MMPMHFNTSESVFEPDLLIRPALHRNEGPHGYLLRLAEANGMRVSALHKLSGSFDVAWLIRNRLVPDQHQQPELHEHAVWVESLLREKKEIWNHRQARYCPLCLAETPIWRGSWELLFHDVCAHHGVWLIDQCSVCHAPISWNRDHVTYCQCGVDLRHAVPTTAPASMLYLASVMEARLLKQQVSSDAAPLEKLRLEHIQHLIRYLGCYMSPAAEPRPLKLRNVWSLQNSWRVSSLAAEILAQWPKAFYACWSRIQDLAPDEKAGISAVFKQAYYHLYKGLCEEAFNPVRGAFEVWTAEYWRGGVSRRNRRLAEEILRQAMWISVKAAADELGVSVNRLRGLVRDGYIEGQEFLSEAGRHFLMIRRDQLVRVNEVLTNEVTMEAAVTVLGIGKLRMRKALRLLFPSASRPNSQMPWRVPKKEVEAIMALGECLPAIHALEDNQVSFAHVLKHWAWPTEIVVVLIQAVKASEHLPVAKLSAGVGVAGWVFDKAPLLAWHAGLEDNQRGWLTIAEVAKAMQIHEESAYWLARNAYLQCDRVGMGKGAAYRIRVEDLESLKTRFVFATELAQTLGRSPKKIVELLTERGIAPLPQRYTATPCRQRVYSRSKEMELFLCEVEGRDVSTLTLV